MRVYYVSTSIPNTPVEPEETRDPLFEVLYNDLGLYFSGGRRVGGHTVPWTVTRVLARVSGVNPVVGHMRVSVPSLKGWSWGPGVSSTRGSGLSCLGVT